MKAFRPFAVIPIEETPEILELREWLKTIPKDGYTDPDKLLEVWDDPTPSWYKSFWNNLPFFTKSLFENDK